MTAAARKTQMDLPLMNLLLIGENFAEFDP
jgi:hypothetical protein